MKAKMSDKEIDTLLDAKELEYRRIAKSGTLPEVAMALALFAEEANCDGTGDWWGPSNAAALRLAKRARKLLG